MQNKNLQAMPVTSLAGVGDKMAQRLAKLGIQSVQDLLFHFPYRYEDRTKTYPIAALQAGQSATVQARIVSVNVSQGRRKMLTVLVRDENASITLRFFHFTAAMRNLFESDKTVIAFGEVKRGLNGLELIHPEFRLINHADSDSATLEHLTPIYSMTEGLRQATLRGLIERALAMANQDTVPELLPAKCNQTAISLVDAIHTLHQPPPDTNLAELEQGRHPAQQRLILEELLAQNLSMLAVRSKLQQDSTYSLPASARLVDALLSSLPFKPTNAQQRVVDDIRLDLQKSTPMMRLVQGDVGSGKTLVAALSALQAIEQGYQVALMAPTEILAEQHALTFSHWFKALNIDVAWLAGKLTGKARALQLEKIATGSAKMVVGTHALFQKEVLFNQLALVIIDEQHRFGVHQRLALREKGSKQGAHPHQLIMTATPIPRTLAMTAYADLDTSVIDELPPGRTAIKTIAVPDTRRIEIVERVHNACLAGRQAYWVCTLIDESEVLEAQAAADTTDDLARALPDLKIGLVHGRMKPSEKQAIMHEFKQGNLHLLVATTVIEVGVDVPNASLMIIENPERLGLAQLHQLRGRVGRGSIASHCVLLYHTPLSKTASQRLAVLRESNDGFIIAEKDLEIRGPGELLGTKQTGAIDFKIADLIRDQNLIPKVQQLAHYIHQQHADNASAIIARWLGNTAQYSNA